FNLELYEKLLTFEKVVAMGEIGLDYYHINKNTDIVQVKNKQQEVFLEQIVLARKNNLPVIIHCRNAHDDTLKVIGEFRKEYKENKKKIKIAIAEAKKILGEKESYLIDIIQFVVFYRTHRTDIMNKAAFLYIPRLKVEAEKIGLTYPELIFCTKDEILSGNIPSKKEINERKNGHVVVEIDKVAKCYTGVIYSSFKKIFLERDNNTKKFGGFIASKGFVKGNVKLVLCREDFKKIKQGDILVASMTTPEMLSLMKKAVGFITDEGGITSHAAIISREMKKPCIIGTKIATKVLHDGDLVEVDANKGVVKILKRGKGKN
ncbi:MAG: TatD family hydrolase, partial [bacterium]